MQQKFSTDIIIIGAGPVGLFAAFQAGMLGMKAHLVDTLPNIGGQCTALYPQKPIYDIPAYPDISAQNLIDNLKIQASPFEPTFHLDQQVTELTKNDEIFTIRTSKNIEISAKAIFIAAGCGAFGPKKPPLAHIEKYENSQVFYHIIDKNLFHDKELVIAGGGDSAVDWAVELSQIVKKIHVVHRRDKFRCAPDSYNKLQNLAKTDKLDIVTPFQLANLIEKDNKLAAIEVKDLDNNSKLLKCDYLLSFFGLAMELGPIKNWQLQLNKTHIEVEQQTMQTNIPGVYAIGDIAHYPNKLKLISVGFAEAAISLHHAYKRVFDGKALHFEYSTTKGIN